MMQAPAFWYRSPEAPGLTARILAPLGSLYARMTARRVAQPGVRLPVPVICIGNINAGGTGKTPATIALVQHLAARGIAAHVVSRGHGGSLTGPVRVDERRHSATETGDEPLLISAFAPTWVSRDRAEGGRAAVADGAQAIILDDGHQNPALVKDLTILTVDAAKGFGNGLCLPAGPLREPVAAGLARGDILLSIGPAAEQARFAETWGGQVRLPHLTGELRPLETGMDWQGMRVLAFAGIGYPEKFFATLRAMGADLARAEPLDDHQPFTRTLLQRLSTEAHQLGAQLVTTEKDAVRLPVSFRAQVLALPVRLELDDWSPIDAAVARLGL